MSDDQRKTRVAADLEFIDSKRFAPVRPISLYDAMARAVAFNLQHSVQQIERDIAKLELAQGNLEGAPDLAGNAGFNRDSATTSTDTDRNIRSGSIGGTWSLLDLGVSYARAKQSADRVLVAEERRRKGLQDIIRNVRLAYWKAVGAQRLMKRMATIESEFSGALAESRRLEVNNIETRRRTVAFRRGLIDTVRQLIAARKEYSRAKLEFAQLVNIRPGVRFTLQPPEAMQGIPALPVAVEEMASFALANRPELRVEDYNERITDWESKEAMYSMFPGLDLNLTRNFSSDAGLVNTSWTGVGTQLGMNLFRLFSGPLRMQAAENRGELARRRRLALSVAVLAQVHIAYREFRETSYQFRLARQISRSDQELSRMARVERRITQGNRLDAIDVAARQLRSEVDQHRAYVELRRAHGDIMHALGLDVIPADISLDDVDGLRTAIRHAMANWETLTEDPDPAKDNTIESLVGQVLADVDREDAIPAEPNGANGPGSPAPSEIEGISAIDPVAGPVGEVVAAPTTKVPAPFETAESDTAKSVTAVATSGKPRPPPYDVQFGAFGEYGRAKGLLAELYDLPQPGGDKKRFRVVKKNHPDKSTLYHLQYGAYSGWTAAQKACKAFARQGQRCTVVRHHADRAIEMDVMPVKFPLDDVDGIPTEIRHAMANWQIPARITAPATDTPRKAPAEKEPAQVVNEKPDPDRATAALAMTAVETTKPATAAPEPSNSTPAQPRAKRWIPPYDVQFGAYGEYRWAQGQLAELQALGRPVAGKRQFRVVRKSHPGKQALYHVQYGAYRGWTAAQKACDAVARQGRKCVVVRHRADEAIEMDVIPVKFPLDDVDGIPTEIRHAMANWQIPARITAPATDTPRKAPAEKEPAQVVNEKPDPDRATAALAMTAVETTKPATAAPEPSNSTPAQPRAKRWIPPYDVQFGAYGEYRWAQGQLAELQALGRPVAGKRQFRVVRKSHPGKQALYHVQYGAYRGWTAAQKACDAFARQGRKCVVVRHNAGKKVNSVSPVACQTPDMCGRPSPFKIAEQPLLILR